MSFQLEDLTLFSRNWRNALVKFLAKPDCADTLRLQLEDACDHALKAESELATLREAVFEVLEGYTLSNLARKKLEQAYFNNGEYQRETVL